MMGLSTPSRDLHPQIWRAKKPHWESRLGVSRCVGCVAVESRFTRYTRWIAD